MATAIPASRPRIRAPLLMNDPERFDGLIHTVEEFMLFQRARIKVGNPMSRYKRQGKQPPARYKRVFGAIDHEEKEVVEDVLAYWKAHPLVGCELEQRIGPLQLAVIVGLLRGNPYIAYPTSRTQALVDDKKKWVWVDDAPYPRAMGQLWQLAGVGDQERTAYNHDLKGRLIWVSIQMLLSGDRAPYDEYKPRFADRVHARPCAKCTPRGKPAAPAGSPWRPGHQDMAAHCLVGKYHVLAPLYDEAKRLHLEGRW